jgi:hypothetical protein
LAVLVDMDVFDDGDTLLPLAAMAVQRLDKARQPCTSRSWQKSLTSRPDVAGKASTPAAVIFEKAEKL